jgi:ribosomal protein L11 methyltransferase
MKWIEIALTVDGEAAEAVAELLQRYGHQGVSVEQADIAPDMDAWEDEIPSAQSLLVRAYIPDDERTTEIKTQLEAALGHLNMMYPMPKPIYTVVNDEDWAEAWKANYHPVRIGRKLLICPRWIDIDPAPDDLVIMLDPGMAFGTGTHPTTQLCLQALEDQVQPTVTVLDLGCGSGILAIAAAKLGATDIHALDIDPIAVKSTLENAQENCVVGALTIAEGSLEAALATGRQFDLAVVNILAKIIIAMCEQNLGETLRPGGIALFSGIIDTQADDVEAALRKTGLEPYARRQEGDWVLIEARRSAQK